MERAGRPVVLLALAALLALVLLPSTALAERGFTARFAQNTQGDIAIAANGSLTCIGTEPQCPPARAGTATPVSQNNNNARVMSYIDVDGDAGTFNSSDAALALPDGATVLFAGLYYGGRLGGGAGGAPAPDPGARGSVLLQRPGDAGYRGVTASQIDEAGDFYHAFADVTAIVRDLGGGVYRVANVQLGTGRADSQVGGWSLVVAYRDAASPSRNLGVYDGFQNVGANSSGVTIGLTGFVTPLAGPVRSTIGIVAFDGDLGTTGDAAEVNGVRLSDASNPANNAFNSSISRAGVAATDRDPAYPNNLGYDADTFATTNVLTNGQTSAQVRLTTSGDAYAPGVVTIATELFAPRIEAVKAVGADAADLGEELTYTMRFANTGEDGAAGAMLADAIPANTTYVPGSLEIVSGTNAGPKTDAAGDDQAEYDAAGNRVVVRLGVFANASNGGLLAAGASATMRFRVRVRDAGVPFGAVVQNRGALSFTAQSTGAADVVQTPPAETAVRVPDAAIVKVHRGAYAPGVSTDVLIAVDNVGDGTLGGPVTVTDTLPAGLTITAAPSGAGWDCSVAGQAVTCTYPDPVAPGGGPEAIVIPVRVDPGADVASLLNTATVSAPGDGDPANDSSTDSSPASGREIDLSVTKTADASRPYDPVRPVEYAITVRNAGPGEAGAVELSDALPAAMDLTSITPSQGTCTGTSCELGDIAPGAEATIALVGTLSADENRYPGDATLTNRAEVTAVGRDRDAADNVATADIQTFPITDLFVDKTFAPAQPVAGGTVTYTFELGNRRQTADASFLDTIPAGLLDVEASIAGGTGICDLDLAGANFGIPIVLCTIPQLESGGRRTVTVTGRLAAETAGTTVSNVAAISSDTALQASDELDDNRDEASFVAGTVDLQLTKARADGVGALAVGAEAVFRLTVRNGGTARATGVVVTDTLPEGLTYAGGPSECTAAGQVVTCGAGPLDAFDARFFDLRVRAEPAAAERTVVNRAAATADQPDAAPPDNEAALDITIGPWSALEATKTAASASVDAGGSAAFTATVRNAGPSTASSVRLVDLPPPGLVLRSATPSRGACAAAACDLGDLPAGASATVEIVADVDPAASGRRVNAVEVTTTSPGAPARAEAAVEVRPRRVGPTPVDVAVTVTPPARAAAGAAGTWILEVVNNGPGLATAVELAAGVSPAGDLVGAREAQAGCARRLPLSCRVGDLGPGERRAIAVRLRPRAPGRLTMAASVTTAQPETTQANNAARASVQVGAGRARLALALRPDATSLSPGDRVVFRLTVRNPGRVAARDLLVCARLPGALAFAGAPGARVRRGAPCWTLPALAPGRTRAFRYSATALAPGGTRAVTSASVTGVNAAPSSARASVRVLQAGPGAPVVTR